jgi:hypothetical protein
MGWGGGVYNNSGGLILFNVNLSDNEASIGGNGLGGGIYNDGVMNFRTGSLAGNLSRGGGGLYNSGNANIENVSLENNSANSGSGGGIYNGGTLTLLNSTIKGRTGDIAGAVRGGGLYNDGFLVITNVTLSGNKASSYGGGLYNGNPGTPAEAGLVNVTLNLNQTEISDGGGGLYNSGNLTSINTIISNSTGGNCSGPEIITSNGHNLEDENTCGLSSAAGDLINTNPNLGPLEDNEGPTLTHALILPSPAINAGDNNGCPATDQRGVRRPLGPTCDIGAYEYNPFIHSLFLPLVIRN